MGSADFSQFVVTTANGTACETSPLKVRALFPHLPATFTGTSGNFWASSLLADLPIFPSLICDSCPSGQGFAYSFLQIPPHDGHPCCSAMCFVAAYAHSGLSPVRACPWRANQKTGVDVNTSSSCLHLIPSAFIVFPENPTLFLRPGVGRAHDKGLLMPLFVLQKILKFMHNMSHIGNTINR